MLVKNQTTNFSRNVCFFVCLRFNVPLDNYFAHMGTSPLLVKGFKFQPIPGTHALVCHTYCDTDHLFNT